VEVKGGSGEADGNQVIDREEDDGDEFVLFSRKRQYVVETQQTATPSVSASEGGGEEDGDEGCVPETPGVGWSDSGEEPVQVPGAPEKKRRRTLPWKLEGLKKCGPLAVEATDEYVSDEEDVWIHGQTNGEDVLDLFPKSLVESESDSETDSGGSSFVVDDEDESVVEELKVAERRLGRVALEEVSVALAEKAERMKRKLSRVYEEQAEVEKKLGEYLSEAEGSGDETGDDAFEVDERKSMK